MHSKYTKKTKKKPTKNQPECIQNIPKKKQKKKNKTKNQPECIQSIPKKQQQKTK